MNWEPWQWGLAIAGAVLVGMSKTGIAGLGILVVAIFAAVVPARDSTGIVLPLLCLGDFVAVASFRRHAQWRHLWRLFPWTAIGVVLGYLALGRIDDRETRLLIGGIILALVALHLFRRWRAGDATEEAHPRWVAPAVGVLAGFTTLVANAAGPLMVIYFLAMRLPKMEFVGTGAVFFLLLNLFKIPFMLNLGLINHGSFAVNLWLAPAVLAGAVAGRWLLGKLNQRLFDNLVLGLSTLAGLKLLL
jgi:uncharacterized membrane protein YfcA